jgi:hypothetical protein
MSALIGGAVFGVLGALPLVGALNCLCCALIIGAGFLAAFLYSKECAKTGTEFNAGGGAKVGVVAGLFYGVVSSIVGGVLAVFRGGYGAEWEEAIEQIQANPEIPAETRDALIGFFESMADAGPVIFIGVGFVLALIFATIGGLIGGRVFKVEAAPPMAPPEPPTV